MKKPRRTKPRPIPEVLTNEEQVRLLAVFGTSTPTKMRNRAMVILMLNAGLRSAEVVNLRHRDIDWKEGKLTIRNGKGGRDRILWMSDEDLNLLGEFVQYGGNHAPSSLLFQTRLGKPIDTRFLRAMLEKKGQQAGIERVHPHLLRHTFATNMLRYTKNLFLVSKALGHSNISTTQIYLHLIDGELEAAMKGMNNGNS